MAQREDLLQAYQYLSTMSVAAFRFENLMASVEGEDGQVWIDPLDPDIMKLFDLRREQRILYDGSKALTTLSFEVYRNTSLWFLILGCTPYVHAHQIPRGEVIMVPTPDLLVSYLQTTKASKGLQGQTIII